MPPFFPRRSLGLCLVLSCFTEKENFYRFLLDWRLQSTNSHTMTIKTISTKSKLTSSKSNRPCGWHLKGLDRVGWGLQLLHAGALVLHLLRLGPLSVDRLVDGHVVLTLEVVGCFLVFERLKSWTINNSQTKITFHILYFLISEPGMRQICHYISFMYLLMKFYVTCAIIFANWL